MRESEEKREAVGEPVEGEGAAESEVVEARDEADNGGGRGRLRRGWRRVRGWFGRQLRRITPGEEVLRALTEGLVGVVMIVCGWFGAGAGEPLGPFWGLVLFSVLAFLSILLGAWAVRLLRRLLAFLPPRATAALVGLIVILGTLRFPPPLLVGALVACVVGSTFMVLGGDLWEKKSRPAAERWPYARWKRAAVAAGMLLSYAALLAFILWLFDRGSSEHLREAWEAPAPAMEPFAFPDPSQPGPYGVGALTYGSGHDKRRPEFGDDAELITPTVDGKPLLTGNDGWKVKGRKWFWGFDLGELPLNGRLWYPMDGDGSPTEGPFPLVLVVHGNHGMDDYSDPGYAYLGELLASRGFLFVSVDQNFLNGGLFDNLNEENDARAWVLLKHLEVWRRWNEDPAHRFGGKVDMDRIALIGHSRGGEAVAIAAAFNRLERYPDNARERFDFGFGIRGVVAIAPVDGQYMPADRRTPVSGVDYLVLQGGHDADVSSFFGARQYQRVKLVEKSRETRETGGPEIDEPAAEEAEGAPAALPEPYRFKASLFAYRANHGQFNTVWGDSDFGRPLSELLNREPLLDGEEQRKIAKVTISAFLEASLHGRREYAEVLRDPRRAAAWLPDDFYIHRFEDVTFRRLAGFEEDLDVTTGTAPWTRFEGMGLAEWQEGDLALRNRGTKENQVVFLGWREEVDTAASSADPSAGEGEVEIQGDGTFEAPSYTLYLAEEEGEEAPEVGSVLVFSMTDTGREPEEADEDEDGKEEEAAAEEDGEEGGGKEEGKEEPPLDLTVVLTDAAGARAAVPLSAVRRLSPPLPGRMLKLPEESSFYGDEWEPHLQTFELPLEIFLAAEPALDLARLRSISWVFDRSPSGVVALDDVGWARADAPSPAGEKGPPPPFPGEPSSEEQGSPGRTTTDRAQ